MCTFPRHARARHARSGPSRLFVPYRALAAAVAGASYGAKVLIAGIVPRVAATRVGLFAKALTAQKYYNITPTWTFDTNSYSAFVA